jgi:antitoxin component YwqK of YwqJK toxin-antitoxin module
MKRKYLGLLIIVACSISASGQNALNAEGLRTGPWKGIYPDSSLRYEAIFENGKPVGLMKRYNKDGSMAATMNFYPGSDRCHVKMYSKSGKVNAIGVYEAQKKDSTWKYLGSDESVRMIENYKLGVLSGVSESFYPSGNLSRRITYESDKKTGEWHQFFENGDTMLVTYYKEDLLHGKFHSLYPEGKMQISGEYYEDIKDGTWVHFSEEGDSITTLHYDKGKVLNPEVLEKSYESFVKYIEDNLGNFPDPAIGGDL